jgi:nicotinamide-nucleotide amidase
MRAEIITIGDEILIGQIVDTNSAWLGQQLSVLGVEVVQISSVSDQRIAIVEALEAAQGRAELILITGGLGPTKDDITKHTLADYFGSRLERNDYVYSRLKAWFEQRGRVMSELNGRQADLPHNAEVLDNELGTAQGMLWRRGGKLILSMPGVPYEMKWIVKNQLIPLLQREFALPIILHRTIMTAGIVESMIAERIATIEAELPAHIKLAFLPRPGIVRLRLSATGPKRTILAKEVAVYEARITAELGHHVYGFDDQLFEAAIGEKLKVGGQQLALAESCTGGNIAQLLTSISGASAYFPGGVVSYSNEAKINMLGVRAETLADQGAVSEATVLEMVAGVREKFAAAYGIAVSGIAGPDGGTPEKPVGTVWIAVQGPSETWVRLYNFGTDRALNIERASMQALYLLWKMLVTN